jgi:hypothetical protein
MFHPGTLMDMLYFRTVTHHLRSSCVWFLLSKPWLHPMMTVQCYIRFDRGIISSIRV